MRKCPLIYSNHSQNMDEIAHVEIKSLTPGAQ